MKALSENVGINATDVLDLFDDADPASTTDLKQEHIAARIDRFLEDRSDALDVIIYFCGHAKLRGERLYLLLKGSTENQEGLTALNLHDALQGIEGRFATRRTYFILDCCFAGRAESDLKKLGPGPLSANLGKVLVASVSEGDPAIAVSQRRPGCTLFTGELVDILENGLEGSKEVLSFEDMITGAGGIRDRIDDPTRRPVLLSSITRNGPEVARSALIVNRRRHVSKRPPARQRADVEVAAHCRTLLILSDAEATARNKLQNAVSAASRLLPLGDQRTAVANATCLNASDAVASPAALEGAIRELARTPVAIIDGTKFDPAAMLLLGIRSVARRGVTIISVGGDYYVGGNLGIPFMIKDANLISHSHKQGEEGRPSPADLIASRIKQGLSDMHSVHYTDLPTFDAIRHLLPDRRDPIPELEGFLVLCSFRETYVAETWKGFLKPGLTLQLSALREGSPDTNASAKRPKLGVARSFELDSPRLVSQAVYEHIRRAQTCVVDWTDWSANVFFEFGVRLAVSSRRHRTVSIIKTSAAGSLTAQQKALTTLFAPVVYDGEDDWAANPDTFDAIIPLGEMSGEEGRPGQLAGDHVYRALQTSLDLTAQPSAEPMERQLLNEAKYFERDATSSRPVSLFPGNQALSSQEATAERERLLAVWAYLTVRRGEDAVMANPRLREDCCQAVDGLISRHYEALATEPDLLARLEAFQDRADRQRRGNQ